jgi:hypothetical protein
MTEHGDAEKRSPSVRNPQKNLKASVLKQQIVLI